MNEYTEVPFNTNFIGRLQHGWVVAKESGMFFSNDVVSTYVWSKHSETWARRHGWTNTVAIGAPWLYLITILEKQGWNRQKTVANEDRSIDELWVYGLHSSLMEDGKERGLREFLIAASESSAKRKLVLLSSTDMIKMQTLNLADFAGLEIATLGDRRNTSSSSSHLHRIFHLLAQVKILVTDYPTTLLLYAATFGCDIRWFKNSTFDLGLETAKNTNNQELLKIMQCEAIFALDIKEFALSNLGADCVQTKEELRRTLRWTTTGVAISSRLVSFLGFVARGAGRFLKIIKIQRTSL